MVIHARFGDVPDSLNFILDTGSGAFRSTRRPVRNSISRYGASDTSITGIGGGAKCRLCSIKNCTYRVFTVEHLNFHVNDYEVLSSVYGEKVDGIIGYSFSAVILYVSISTATASRFTNLVLSATRKKEHCCIPRSRTCPSSGLQVKDRKRQGFNFISIPARAFACCLVNNSPKTAVSFFPNAGPWSRRQKDWAVNCRCG